MSFDFLRALLGGALIGLGAAVLLLTQGRIAGASGILAGVLAPRRGDVGWRIAFLLALLAAGAAFVTVWPERFSVTAVPQGAPLVAAGVLVGFGTRLGNGCTSGHGVCGLGRGSPRSLAATLTFMATAIATVFVVRHVL